METIRSLLTRPEFPRSSRYDPDWVIENQMGPNALWLVEWLCGSLDLRPGMRVLDLGCGRAMTSVFLAREFGARVWAADLWIGPDENWKRVVEAGLENLICPVRAEAHALPFASAFFDAAISIDAYTYFGTDDLYLGYLSRFVRPGGTIGIVVPGLEKAFENGVPAHLTQPQRNGKRFWEDECSCFHTAAWWQTLWSNSGRVCDVKTDALPDGWRYWRDFENAIEISGKARFPSDAETLERDGGQYLGFVRVTARRTDTVSENLYDPALGARVGVD